jgi:hypothetical protein
MQPGELLAHPQPNRIRTIGDDAGAGLLHATERAGDARHIGQRTQVTMTACGSYHGAGRINARARHEPLVDRLLQREGRAAKIPDRGETAHQGALGLRAGSEIDVADIRGHQSRERQRGKDGMPMGVDQTRHKDSATAIDHMRTVWRSRVALRHGLDPVALNEQTKTVAQSAEASVEQPEIREQGRPRRLARRRLRIGEFEQAERCSRNAHAGDKPAS